VPPTTFRAKLGGDGGDVPAVIVPFDVKAAYGSARPKVKVTVNGVTLRTTVAVYGGRSYIGFRKEICQAAGLQLGKIVTVAIEPDTEPRVVDVPDDLACALGMDPSARTRFEALSYTHRREHAQWVADAKKPETRQRRVARVIEMLTAGR
jgi:Bacteriocin-protection, YdeI or OmpD-Associated/Domain of unknown function (DUF1905)